MLDEVEQDIDGETAEEVDAVGAQEWRVKGVARHLVAGPGKRAAEGAQRSSRGLGQTAGSGGGHEKRAETST